ncbi:hypothetical protein JCM19238_2197 [Vibrio ponticus]|nr:hypothetical protein JCM19238_2197 [Vibrio ponticus]
MIEVNQPLKSLISQQTQLDTEQLQMLAIDNGTTPLLESGKEKLLAGETSLNELERVLGFEA